MTHPVIVLLLNMAAYSGQPKVMHTGKSYFTWAPAIAGQGLVPFAALVPRLWLSRLMQELRTQDKAIVNPFPIIGIEMVNRAQEQTCLRGRCLAWRELCCLEGKHRQFQSFVPQKLGSTTNVMHINWDIMWNLSSSYAGFIYLFCLIMAAVKRTDIITH